MVNYQINTDTEKIPIKVVNNSTWGGAQQTVIYESPGTNGGVVIVTGRTTNTITLNGKLIGETNTPLIYLNSLKNKLLNIKDKGTPITLISPIDNNDTGRYIITEFTGNVVEGVATYLPFTMTLTEHREANVKTALVNLISFEPAETFRALKKLREQGG